MKHSIHYLNNGKVAQNNLIHSTLIKSKDIKNIKVTNGKLFNKEFTDAFQEGNLKKSNLDENKNINLASWLTNTLNPINHIPIISTINKMVSKTNKSLDLAQAAIGGAIYGGGPIGLAKGIGGWFFNKLMSTNKIAKSTKTRTEDTSSTDNTLKDKTKIIEKQTNSNEFIHSSKVNLKESKKNLSSLSNISETQKKLINNNFFYYHSIETKKKTSIIDTDA